MRHRNAVTTTTGIRRWVRALRPVFVLGGFVVVWWCLATGAAQASDGPHHDLGTTTKALGATADRVVHQTAHRALDRGQHASHSPKVTPKPVRHVTEKVTKTITHQVAPVRSVVEKTVEQTPVKPVLKKVAPVLDKVSSTLSTTPLGPVVKPVTEDVSEVVQGSSAAGEFASLQGETSSSQSAYATLDLSVHRSRQ